MTSVRNRKLIAILDHFRIGYSKVFLQCENVSEQILMVKRGWKGDIPNFSLSYVLKQEKVWYSVNKGLKSTVYRQKRHCCNSRVYTLHSWYTRRPRDTIGGSSFNFNFNRGTCQNPLGRHLDKVLVFPLAFLKGPCVFSLCIVLLMHMDGWI